MKRTAFLLLTVWVVTLLAACGATPSPTVDTEATIRAAVAATLSARGSAPSPSRTPALRPGKQPTPRQSPVPTAPPAGPTLDTAAAMASFSQALARGGPFSAPDAGAPPQGNLNPFVHLFPALRDLPPPSWLREGVRVSYYGQSATIAQVAGEEGAGGAGYLQCDLVALDGQAAAVSMKLYLDVGNGTVIPVLVLPSVGLPAAGDYWLHPDVLRDAERVANDELVVVHMPTEIGGQSYRAVRFEYRPAGAEYVWMFDQDSGLLLFYRHAIGTEDDPHRQLTDVTLVGVRQVELPWAGGAAPGWVREGGYLEYEGTYTALVMGKPAASFDYSLRAEVRAAFPRWSVYRVTDRLAGRNNAVTWRLNGAAQLFDAIWLSPQALAALRGRPRTLDSDPVTGEKFAVSRGPSGEIVLTASNSAYEVVLTYDGDDGTLVALEQQVIGGAAGTLIRLQLTGRQ